MPVRSLFVLGLLLGWCGLGASTPNPKEQLWQSEIIAKLRVGEAVLLKADEREFLALYTASRRPATRGVLLIHGLGAHPAWPAIIEPLRRQLPEYGWHSFSLQMPIPDPDTPPNEMTGLFKQAAQRVTAGIGHFKQKGVNQVVIIAHDLGAAMAAHYLTDKPDAAILGFVAIGMGSIDADPPLHPVSSLAKLKLPVLDLYGDLDLQSVLETAKQRVDAAQKAANPRYQQLKIDGADHYFTQMDDELIRRIRGWLSKIVSGKRK